MSHTGTNQLLIKMFEAPVEEIGNDPDKVEIMHEFHSAMRNSHAAIPQGILQLYEKVYLRDVWAGANKENGEETRTGGAAD